MNEIPPIGKYSHLLPHQRDAFLEYYERRVALAKQRLLGDLERDRAERPALLSKQAG